MIAKSRTTLSVAAALAGAVSLAALAASAQPATSMPAGMEKCYGISRAGEHQCANTAGTHSCAGQSKVDNGKDSWKYVATGTCKQMGGLSADEAKAAAKKS